MNEHTYGKIIRIHGQVVEVRFDYAKPSIHDLLVMEENPSVKMEVYASSEKDTYFCLVFSPTELLRRGARVINTGGAITIPLGKELLGRVIDAFGTPLDGKGEIKAGEQATIYRSAPPYRDIVSPEEIIETGIKAVDLFCPILKGGKVGLLGGAGLGKTVVLTELLYHVIVLQKNARTMSVFAGIGERTREGQELIETLAEKQVLPGVSVVLGPMGAHPAIRFLTGFTAVRIAEYFRDAMGQNVLFFIDNMFRFSQAGNELSMVMNIIPSEDGYQPTLETEVSSLEERLSSVPNASVTTIEAIYVPSDDILDQAVQAIFSHLDSAIVFSREVFQQNLLPAIDILASHSSALNPQTVGELHYQTALHAQGVLKKAASLERIVSLIGDSELAPEDRLIYQRAKKLRNFMTQELFVLETQNATPGVYVPLEKNIRDVGRILAGEFDEAPQEKFLYIGTLEDIKG